MSKRSHRRRSWSARSTGAPEHRSVHARRDARGLQIHERNQPVDLGLPRLQGGDQAPQPHGLTTQLRPDPRIAGGRGIPLVEDEEDDLEDGGESLAHVGPGRELEGHPFCLESALGSHDPLRHCRLRHQERPSDLRGVQPAETPQGQRDTRVHRQRRMAGGEDEPEQVVADLVVHRVVDRGAAVRGLQHLDGAAGPSGHGCSHDGGGRPPCASRWSSATRRGWRESPCGSSPPARRAGRPAPPPRPDRSHR